MLLAWLFSLREKKDVDLESKAKHRRFRSVYRRVTYYSLRKEQKVSKVPSVEAKFYFLPPVFRQGFSEF